MDIEDRFVAKIKAITDDKSHAQVDRVLLELLEELGFRRVVAAYDEIDKRYAPPAPSSIYRVIIVT